jgi:hypothetical protein
MIHIVEEIQLLLLLGNRLKHIRGNVRYLVTWNIKGFTVGYFLRLDTFFIYILAYFPGVARIFIYPNLISNMCTKLD